MVNFHFPNLTVVDVVFQEVVSVTINNDKFCADVRIFFWYGFDFLHSRKNEQRYQGRLRQREVNKAERSLRSEIKNQG